MKWSILPRSAACLPPSWELLPLLWSWEAARNALLTPTRGPCLLSLLQGLTGPNLTHSSLSTPSSSSQDSFPVVPSSGNHTDYPSISLLPTSIHPVTKSHPLPMFHASPICSHWGPISISVYITATTFWSPASVALRGRSLYLSLHYHQDHIPQTLWTCPTYSWDITHCLQIKSKTHRCSNGSQHPLSAQWYTKHFHEDLRSMDWQLRGTTTMCKVLGSIFSTTTKQ